MIIRYGGGNSGIKEYLEKGRKADRHFTRDELDVRVTVEGDLDVTQSVIEAIEDKDQDRYLHISMSFNEPDVTEEKMIEVFGQYKRELMHAYKSDEFNMYAEIHWPKIKEAYNHKTNKMEPRFPHIHIVIPKKNLLTSGFLNPVGLHEKSLKYFDAIQEKLNRDNGLSSPRNSPRLGSDHYVEALARYKDKELGTKNGEVKQAIFDRMIAEDITSLAGFQQMLGEFGEVKIRNENKEGQYFAVKMAGDSKFTNLKAAIFSRPFIETRALMLEPITDAQVAKRVQTWRDVKSREIKYISNASADTKGKYRELNLEGRRGYLNELEEYYEGKHRGDGARGKRQSRADRGAKRPNKLPRAPTGNYKPSNFKFAPRITTKEPSDLHELRTRTVDHFGSDRGSPDRLLLPRDESNNVQHVPSEGHAGLRHNPYSGSASKGRGRRLDVDEQSSVVTSYLSKQLDDADKEMDSSEIENIRLHLSAKTVLGYCQAIYGLDASLHATSTVKDGSARIRCGKYRYNVSDFLTKYMRLDWHEAAPILKDLYAMQEAGTVLKAEEFKAPALEPVASIEPVRPLAVVAYAQLYFGVDPDDHPITTARNGTPRIKCGKFNYTPADYLTKFIGLSWKEAKIVLAEIRNLEATGTPLNPKPKEVHTSVWRDFREKHYPQKLATYNELKSAIKVSSGLQFRVINSEFYARRRAISQDPNLTREQRHLMRSIAILEKLQKLEALKEKTEGQKTENIQTKYPFSRLFADYSLNNEVANMKYLNQLKEKYLAPSADTLDDENTIGQHKPIGPQSLPTGRAALQRAKLIQQLQKPDRKVGDLKIKMGDLQPKPLKTGGIAFDNKTTGATVFVNHPDKVALNRTTTPDEVAIGMMYAIERFGSPLEVHGTKEFIEQVIFTAAERDMDITFSDESMNKRLNEVRLELGMAALEGNTLEVDSLVLDKSLPIAEAIDKALLESRVTELRAIQASPSTDEFKALSARLDAFAEQAGVRHAELAGATPTPEQVRDLAAADLIDYSQMEGMPQQQAMALLIGNNLANPIYREQMENNGPAELFLTIEAAQVIEKSKAEVAAVEVTPEAQAVADQQAAESAIVSYFQEFEKNTGLTLEQSLTFPLIVKEFAAGSAMSMIAGNDTSEAGMVAVAGCMETQDFRERFKTTVLMATVGMTTAEREAIEAEPGYQLATKMVQAAEMIHGEIQAEFDPAALSGVDLDGESVIAAESGLDNIQYAGDLGIDLGSMDLDSLSSGLVQGGEDREYDQFDVSDAINDIEPVPLAQEVEPQDTYHEEMGSSADPDFVEAEQAAALESIQTRHANLIDQGNGEIHRQTLENGVVTGTAPLSGNELEVLANMDIADIATLQGSPSEGPAVELVAGKMRASLDYNSYASDAIYDMQKSEPELFAAVFDSIRDASSAMQQAQLEPEQLVDPAYEDQPEDIAHGHVNQLSFFMNSDSESAESDAWEQKEFARILTEVNETWGTSTEYDGALIRALHAQNFTFDNVVKQLDPELLNSIDGHALADIGERVDEYAATQVAHLDERLNVVKDQDAVNSVARTQVNQRYQDMIQDGALVSTDGMPSAEVAEMAKADIEALASIRGNAEFSDYTAKLVARHMYAGGGYNEAAQEAIAKLEPEDSARVSVALEKVYEAGEHQTRLAQNVMQHYVVELAKASDVALRNISESYSQIQREAMQGHVTPGLQERAVVDIRNLTLVQSLDKAPHVVAMVAKNMANPEYAKGVQSELAHLHDSGFKGLANLKGALEESAKQPTLSDQQIEIMQADFYQAKHNGDVAPSEPTHDHEID